MKFTRLDELILDYQSGALDAAGVAELDAALRKNPQAGARFAFWSRQAVALHEVCEATAERRVNRGRVSRRLATARPRRRVGILIAFAAAAAAALVVALVVPSLRPSHAATQASGWTIAHGAGTIRNGDAARPVAVDTVLAEGETIEASPAIELRNGDSWMRLAQQGSARIGANDIAVERGLLSAKIAHRPAGDPLRIETPTATATIVGTAFSLDATGERTRLRVDDGRVRLARGTDAVEVAAGEECAASATGALTKRSAFGVGGDWLCRFVFTDGVPLGCEDGEFIAGAGPTGGGVFRAIHVPVVKGTGVHDERLRLASSRIEGAGLFRYDPRVVVRATFRLQRRAAAAIELFLHIDKGTESRNLHAKLTYNGASSEWTSIAVPITEFGATGDGPFDPTGGVCRSWLFDSYHSDCQLDLAEFGVALPDAQGK